MNYRHPGLRRVRNLGPELPAVHHFRQIRLIGLSVPGSSIFDDSFSNLATVARKRGPPNLGSQISDPKFGNPKLGDPKFGIPKFGIPNLGSQIRDPKMRIRFGKKPVQNSHIPALGDFHNGLSSPARDVCGDDVRRRAGRTAWDAAERTLRAARFVLLGILQGVPK